MEPSLKIDQKINLESENLVLYEENNYVATLTLNRPKKFNALSEEMLTILQKILDDIAANNLLKIVIIQGAGKSFCAGHDLKEMITKRDEIYYKNLFLKCSKI